MEDLPIFATTITKKAFEHYVKRQPETQEEYEKFAYFIEKGIEASVDLQTIYKEAAEAINTKQRG